MSTVDFEFKVITNQSKFFHIRINFLNHYFNTSIVALSNLSNTIYINKMGVNKY